MWDKIKQGLKDATEKGIEYAGEQKEKSKEKAKESAEYQQKRLAEQRERLQQLDREGVAYCPKCKSTSLSGGKRGWKLSTGLIGSGKTIITCMKCGNKFKPGKR